ncbi:hypothetical protein IU458_34810 [Nocardia nova]|nr:hypothetical protein [Nocardia nova]
MADDRDLSFQLADPAAASTQFCRLRAGLPGRSPRFMSSWRNLFDKVTGVDAEFNRGLLSGFARPDQSDRSGTELGGISA